MLGPKAIEPNTYQWIRTERKGEVSVVDYVEDGYTVFKDGTRCAVDLMEELLYHMPSAEDKLLDLGEKIELAKEKSDTKLSKQLRPKKSEKLF